MESLFIQLSDDVYISISKNWPLDRFCGPGSHLWTTAALLSHWTWQILSIKIGDVYCCLPFVPLSRQLGRADCLEEDAGRERGGAWCREDCWKPSFPLVSTCRRRLSVGRRAGFPDVASGWRDGEEKWPVWTLRWGTWAIPDGETIRLQPFPFMSVTGRHRTSSSVFRFTRSPDKREAQSDFKQLNIRLENVLSGYLKMWPTSKWSSFLSQSIASH